MSNTKDFNYKILETQDGSPTLLLSGAQPMHSMEGALSETLQIYKPVAEGCLVAENPQILSLGLGLGYNELMTATIFLQAQKKDYQIHSFESVPSLVEYFQSWMREEDSPLNSCYDRILEKISKEFLLEERFIKEELNKIIFYGAIPSENPTSQLFHGIYYDAFSSITDPQLWTQEHFESFLKTFSAENCCMATYASTGILKRALSRHNFVVESRKGFGKKRESIFAFRKPA